MIPKLRFPEFTDEWESKKLGEVISFKNGKPFEDYVNSDGPYSLITIDSVDIAGNLKKKFKKVTRTDNSLRRDDIVTVLSDIAHGELLGLTSLIPKDDEYVLNQRMGRLRPRAGDSPLFLSQYINTQQIFFRKRGQGTSQRHIYERDIDHLPIFLPSISEQQKIADFLTTIDKKIETIDKKVELLKQYKKGVMQKIFTQQIRFKDEGGKDYPEWGDRKIGDVTQLFSTRNKILAGAPVYSVTNKNGFVLQTEHFKKVIAGDDLRSYKIIEKDDFAYNPARINVGSIARFKQNIGTISSLYVCFRPTKELNPTFLEYFLQLDRTKFYFNTFGEGGVRIYLWYPLFALIKINLPSLAEQQKIADFLSAIDDKIKAEETKLVSAKKYKKALLQRMFV